MGAKIVGSAPAKFAWKRLTATHIIGAIALFAALWVILGQLPDEDARGIALLPAVTVCFCRPETRREWLRALGAAFAVALLQLGGRLIGFVGLGIWPPQTLSTGADAQQFLIALSTVLGSLVAFPSIQVLGRQEVRSAYDIERTYVDLSPMQIGVLTGTGLTTLFVGLFAERLTFGFEDLVAPGVSILAMLIILCSGRVVLLAWPRAGTEKPFLIARFAISILIGIAGYLVFAAVYHHYQGPSAGAVQFLILIAVYFIAPAIGWWQLRRFARQYGMLRSSG